MSAPSHHAEVIKKSRSENGWKSAPVLAAYIGILASLLFNYLNFAKQEQWIPFTRTCPSILNSLPESISRNTAGAYADGYNRALVKWQPPMCQGSSEVTGYVIYAWDSETKQYTPEQDTPATSRSYIFTGLTDWHFYLFYIQAESSVGRSYATTLNFVEPPRVTGSGPS